MDFNKILEGVWDNIVKGTGCVGILASAIQAAITTKTLTRKCEEGETPAPYAYGVEISQDAISVFQSGHEDIDVTSQDWKEFCSLMALAVKRAFPAMEWKAKEAKADALLVMNVRIDSGVELGQAIAGKLASATKYTDADKLAFVTDAAEALTGLKDSYTKKLAPAEEVADVEEKVA